MVGVFWWLGLVDVYGDFGVEYWFVVDIGDYWYYQVVGGLLVDLVVVGYCVYVVSGFGQVFDGYVVWNLVMVGGN